MIIIIIILLCVHLWKELVLRQSILGVVGHIMSYNVEDLWLLFVNMVWVY